MHRSLSLVTVACALLAGCPVAQTVSSAVLVEVKRTTKQEAVVCALSMDHVDMVPISTTTVEFEILSPAELAGRRLVLELFEKPARAESFSDVLSQDRFLLRLRSEDFTHPAPLEFRSVVLRFGPPDPKEGANQSPEPMRAKGPHGSF